MNAKKVGGILAGSAFLYILGVERWNEGVGLWNELLLWAVGVGQLGNGFIIPQTILLGFVGALVFGTVVPFGNRTLPLLAGTSV